MSGDSLQYRLEEIVLSPCEWRWTVKGNGEEVMLSCCAESVQCRSVVDDSNRRNLFFFVGLYVRPPPKLTYKRHILVMSTSPRNDSHCPKFCRLSCIPITNIETPSKVPILVVFVTYETTWAEIRKCFTGLRMHSPIRVFYFKSGQNRCRITDQKSALYWWQKKNKTHFGILRWDPWADFP